MAKPAKKRRVRVELEAALASHEAVRLIGKRAGTETIHKGYVVGLGPGWVLLHALLLDPFVMNGYAAVPVAGLRTIERFSDVQPFVPQALLLRGMECVEPKDVDAGSVADLIRTAGTSYPLVSVFVEDGYKSCWYVGKVLRVGGRKVEMRVIDAEGAWSSTHTLPLRTITAVEFDDGYSRALWMVNQAFHNTLLAGTPNVGSA